LLAVNIGVQKTQDLVARYVSLQSSSVHKEKMCCRAMFDDFAASRRDDVECWIEMEEHSPIVARALRYLRTGSSSSLPKRAT
jgi:hypothetical protein